MRIKYYYKTLALMQSDSAMKSLGINTRAIYYPTVRMGQALRESRDVGQSRIEITYTAVDLAGQAEILDDEFPLQTTIDLNHAEAALRGVKGLTWHISQLELQD